ALAGARRTQPRAWATPRGRAGARASPERRGPAEAPEKPEPPAPIEPIEANDPTEPIDRADPFDAIDRHESSDQRESALRVEDFTARARPRRSGRTGPASPRPSRRPARGALG